MVKKILKNKKIKEPITYPEPYKDNDTNENYKTLKDLLEVYDFDCIDNNLINITKYGSLVGSKNGILRFNIEDIPGCCAIQEIKDIKCDNFDIKDTTAILDYIGSIKKGITFMINTNGIRDCVPFEQALSKCKYFTLVKTFKNANTGNIIKIWLSNQE